MKNPTDIPNNAITLVPSQNPRNVRPEGPGFKAPLSEKPRIFVKITQDITTQPTTELDRIIPGGNVKSVKISTKTYPRGTTTPSTVVSFKPETDPTDGDLIFNGEQPITFNPPLRIDEIVIEIVDTTDGKDVNVTVAIHACIKPGM